MTTYFDLNDGVSLLQNVRNNMIQSTTYPQQYSSSEYNNQYKYWKSE